MAWLDFLKNGNELAELLIEGQNPYSASLLQAADVAPLQSHMPTNEPVLAYALGRVVLAGRGLWVLTERHLLIAQPGSDHAVRVLPLAQLSEAECLRGKYGYTLRVTAGGQRYSLYGTSASLAAVFYQTLGRTVACAPVFKPTPLDADDLAQVAHHFAHAAALLSSANTRPAHTVAA
jgi:hypothetical protein